MISRIDQQGGISGAGVRGIFPGRVRLNRRKRVVREGLYPPHSSPGEQHDPLIPPRAPAPALDGMERVRAALAGRWNPAEFNGGLDGRLRESATAGLQTEQAHRNGAQNIS